MRRKYLARDDGAEEPKKVMNGKSSQNAQMFGIIKGKYEIIPLVVILLIK